ncbi:ribosome maturation factor RimM [Thermosporothrix hazakensis]|jgi:16S rRNA processing protein RimM|nr:ribosome maturation factor RimM [Thermosporothrix hazakensis]
MQNKTEWATIGKIVALFGVRGELKVQPLTDIPDRFTTLKAVYLTPGYTRHTIESVRPYKGTMILLKLRGFNDANAVEALRGQELCIPVEQLAELPPDSYYQHDILGLRVLTLGNTEIGHISDIIATGGNDIYVITSVEGKQVMIPAVKAIIKQIDLVRHVMYIDPIPGLLDDDALVDDPNKPYGEDE